MAIKVERLLNVVVPGATIRPVVTPRGQEQSSVRSPVSARSHDGSLDREAELAAMKAKMAALELAEAQRQAQFEALQADNKRRQAEFEALQSTNKTLLREVRVSSICLRVEWCARLL